MKASSLKDRAAIVTGGTRGIGRAVVKALAESGADVVIGDVRGEEARATASAIEQETGRRIVAIPTDVSQLEDAKRMCAAALREFGKIDILVNNAGWERLTPFVKSSPDFWDKVIAVNYRGVIHTCYAALPHMMERKQGSIVNISSDSARVGSLGEAVYSGAKAAVIAFSKTLAREHARDNIRVNVICPGLVETPLLNEIQEEPFGQKILGAVTNQIPLKRLAQPEDIAPMAVFLASDDARYITGQVTSVNGGLTMVG
jgi:2-hydroxycyclohexanecarboxyl-CoA dehydrogenase